MKSGKRGGRAPREKRAQRRHPALPLSCTATILPRPRPRLKKRADTGCEGGRSLVFARSEWAISENLSARLVWDLTECESGLERSGSIERYCLGAERERRLEFAEDRGRQEEQPEEGGDRRRRRRRRGIEEDEEQTAERAKDESRCTGAARLQAVWCCSCLRSAVVYALATVKRSRRGLSSFRPLLQPRSTR